MKTQRIIAFTLVAVLFSLGASPATAQGLGATPGISYPRLTRPIGIDLDVTYISRTPMYNRYAVLYTPDLVPYLQAGTENNKRWPSPGEAVTFTAHTTLTMSD